MLSSFPAPRPPDTDRDHSGRTFPPYCSAKIIKDIGLTPDDFLRARDGPWHRLFP